jgi:hypothetical protein
VQTSPWEAELQAARRQAADPVFQASYRRWRPMVVERSIAWLVAGGNRGGAVAFAATAVEQRDWPHENAPSSPYSGSTV